jgi:uncharacterized damage-inducible protein DinB
MQLKATARAILSQIFDLIQQLSEAEYTSELDLLNGNTIGKHIRHIVEFFDLLVSGSYEGIINYDKREHSQLFESDIHATISRIKELLHKIDQMNFGGEVYLVVSYSETDDDAEKIKSSLERELAYNIEHAIHHMAIIKIAIQTVFPKIQLSDNFGVAYSTVRYQKSSKN